MTRPVIGFGDPQLATRNILRALLPEATVSTRDAPSPGPRPYVVVRTDGPTRTARQSADALIRISVYGGDDGLSVALAARIEALLLAEAGDEVIRSYGPFSGPAPTTDPDTGDPFALVTLAARMRPIHL